MEKSVPSTDLFPIHHLDELEFFPGDYVLPANDAGQWGSGVVSVQTHSGLPVGFLKWGTPSPKILGGGISSFGEGPPQVETVGGGTLNILGGRGPVKISNQPKNEYLA